MKHTYFSSKIVTTIFRTITIVILSAIALLWASMGAKATTYTSAAPGNWNATGSWDANGIPSEPLAAGDVINITHALTLSNALTINGTLTWNTPSATVDINQTIVGTGAVSITGNIINVSVSITMTGSGTLSLTSTRNTSVSGSNSLSVVNGNMTMVANNSGNAGIFSGIAINTATLSSSGTGNISLTAKGGFTNGTNKGIELLGGGQINSTSSGAITLNGTGGLGTSSSGIYLTGTNTKITSAGGNISLTGQGGQVANDTKGVWLDASSAVTTTNNANITISGTGGTTPGTNRQGVNLSAATVSTANGNITLSGTGGSGVSTGQYGVLINGTPGSQVTAGGSGTLTINGTGGNTATASTYGVYVTNANTTVASTNGNLSITGTGGNTGTGNYGVHVASGGVITALGTATVTVQGTGGNSTGANNHGVYVTGNNSAITSGGGNVIVTGIGKGTGTSATNYGVNVLSSGKITSGGNGKVSVTGTGGNASGSGGTNHGVYIQSNGQITSGGTDSVVVKGTGSTSTGSTHHGVFVDGNGSKITSGGGPVSVTGTGGGSGASGSSYGVHLLAAGLITAGGSGTVTVSGTGLSTTGGAKYGVIISGTSGGNASQVTSSGGNVSVTGQSSGSGPANYGIQVTLAGKITAGGSGTVTVQGTGGPGNTSNNYGIVLSSANSTITSSGGAIFITGQGDGGPTSSGNRGIYVGGSANINTGGSGSVTITGTGGNTTGSNNQGVLVDNAVITSTSGSVTVTGYGNGSSSSDFGYGVLLQNSGQITSSGSGGVFVTGEGGAGTGTSNHGVSVQVPAGISTSGGGNISVTGTRGSNSAGTADISLSSTGSVTTTSTGGNITFNSITGGTWPSTSTTDASTIATKTISFGANSKLNIAILGTTVNTNYLQLNVAGLLNLNNATLTFSGSTHTPVLGNSFTIADNDGSDAITGTFSGLAEGAYISNFLGSALSAQITYVGGSGNDAVLTVVNPPVAVTWDGSSSTDWNTGANWSTNAVPSSTDDVTIPNMTNDPVISGSFTINNINLQSGTPLTVAAGGSLTLNGTLTNAGAVTIQSGGSFLQGGSSSISGGGTFTVQRQGTSSPTRFNYWSTPVSGGILPGSNGYRYNSAAGTNSNSDDSPADPGWVSHSGAMTTGLGYASMGGGLASFTGTPNNGTINIPVTYYGLSPTSTSPNSDFVHLGNPYPSGLTLNTFLTDNSSRLSGQVWAWDDDNSNGVNYTTSDYASRTTAGSISGGNGNSISAQIASCQGFVVKAISSGNVVFQNTQRNAAAGTFLKTEELTSRIWLSLSNDTLYNEINVVFMDGATAEFDHMLDGLKLRANPAIAFAVNPEGNTAQENELCIAALPPVMEETVVALTTFVAGEGVYTIRNKEVENMDNMDVYLEDRLTGAFTNLSNHGEYSTLMNAQNTENRFFVHFGTLSTGISKQSAPPFVAYINGNELVVLVNTGVALSDVEGITLTDMTGKTILNQQRANSQENTIKINISSLAQGIYAVSLQTKNNVYSGKIVVR